MHPKYNHIAKPYDSIMFLSLSMQVLYSTLLIEALDHSVDVQFPIPKSSSFALLLLRADEDKGFRDLCSHLILSS